MYTKHTEEAAAMTKRPRLVILLLALSVLLALVLPACDGKTEEEREIFIPSGESAEIRWAFFAGGRDVNETMSAIINTLNVRLKNQGVGVYISPYFIPTPAHLTNAEVTETYENFAGKEIASGDTEFDLITCGANTGFFKWRRNGLLEDLAPYLDQYLYLRETIAKDKWDYVTSGGQIFALPTDFVESKDIYADIYLRTEDNPPYFPDVQSFYDYVVEMNRADGSVLFVNDSTN